MPPWTLPDNKTNSGVKSRSSLQGGADNFNKLSFEDKKGSELVSVQAEKDLTTLVKNDENREVQHDRVTLIKNDETQTVTNNEKITVEKGNQTIEDQDGQSEHHDRAGQSVAPRSRWATNRLQIKMGNQTNKIDLGKIETEAMQSIELKVGQSSIKIDQMGVTIKGMMIKVEAQIQGEVQSCDDTGEWRRDDDREGRHRDDQLRWAATPAQINSRTGRDLRGRRTRRGGDGAACVRTCTRWILSALLMEKAMYPDAVRFIAHALPKREAVWWGWVCARRSAGENPPPKIKAALDATEKWIAQPNDDNRRLAMAAAEKAELGTAAGCAGLAAFFSGESLAPPRRSGGAAGRVSGGQSGSRRGDLRRRCQGARAGAGEVPKFRGAGRGCDQPRQAVGAEERIAYGNAGFANHRHARLPGGNGNRAARRRSDSAAGSGHGADRRAAGGARRRHGDVRRTSGRDRARIFHGADDEQAAGAHRRYDRARRQDRAGLLHRAGGISRAKNSPFPRTAKSDRLQPIKKGPSRMLGCQTEYCSRRSDYRPHIY